MINFILKKRSFNFHFWATLFSGCIWPFIYLIAYIYSKQTSNSDSSIENINNYTPEELHKLCAQKMLSNASSLKTDLVEFSYHCACCGECAKYRGRVFSISGKDKRFPKLPEHILQTGQVHDGCRCSFYPFIFGISEPSHTEAKDIIKFSNRPFIDDRTKIEKADYEEFIKQMKIKYQKEIDKKYYQQLLNKFPEITPKTFSAYRKLRNLNNEKFNNLKLKANELGIDLDELDTKELNEV